MTDTETLRSRWQLLALRGKHPPLSEVTALLRGDLLPGVQARDLSGQWPFDLAALLAPRDHENWGRLLSDFAAAAALDDDLFDRLGGEGPDIWTALAGSWTAELAWNDAVRRLQDNPRDLLTESSTQAPDFSPGVSGRPLPSGRGSAVSPDTLSACPAPRA